MKAVTRNKLMNNLYLVTFLVAFSSVAMGTILPCPAHTVDSESQRKNTEESMLEKQKQQQQQQQQQQKNKSKSQV
ncbi:cytochrome c oxidase assembly factor 2 [Monosporozyma unispora]